MPVNATIGGTSLAPNPVQVTAGRRPNTWIRGGLNLAAPGLECDLAAPHSEISRHFSGRGGPTNNMTRMFNHSVIQLYVF